MTHRALGVALLAACGQVEVARPDANDAPPHEIVIEVVDVDGAPVAATFVAVQDGDGPWASVEPAGTGYRTSVSDERYGVAVGCADARDSTVEIFHRTTAESLPIRVTCFQAKQPASPIGVSVRGVAGTVLLQTRGATAVTVGDGNVAIDERHATTELFASERVGSAIQRLVRLAPFSVPSLPIAIDFATQGIPVERHPITGPEPTGPEPLLVSSRVTTPLGTYRVASEVATTYAVPAPVQRRPDDLFSISASAGDRAARHVLATPRPLAITFPAPFEASPPSLIATPYLHAELAFTATPSVLANQVYRADLLVFRIADDTSRLWSVELSSAWVGAPGRVHYELPDLTAVAGFSATAFALYDREPIDWVVSRAEDNNVIGAGHVVHSASARGLVGAFCGDGVVQPPEACDTGLDDSATCDFDCTPVACGDGHLNAVVEECDPPDGSTCSTACRLL